MKRKTYRRLRADDRHTIQRLRKAGKSQREIAAMVGCSQSTISKELSRNRGGCGYRSGQAQRFASERQQAKRPRRRTIDGAMSDQIRKRLAQRHSPAQISGALRRNGGAAPCHETIYAHIRSDRRSGGSLWLDLRINGKRRYRRRAGRRRDKIPGRVDISERPVVVGRRSRYGDWEVDLIAGKRGGGYLLSLVERKSRYGKLVKLSGRNSGETARAVIAALKGFRVKTLTYDNGAEFPGHREVNKALGSASYFCQPYHSWEKGGVENFNGLVRQYHPKGSDLSAVGPGRLRQVERELNERPRKCLAFRCPEDYRKHIAT